MSARRRIPPTLLALAATGVLMVSGCRLSAPDRRPEAPAPTERFREIPGIPTSRWWELFNEPELNALITAALRENPDVLESLARVREARARLAVATAGFYPTARADASATRGRRSSNTDAGNRSVGDNFSASGTLAYEVDLWGRAANLTDAADADYRAALGDWESARLTLVAEIMSSWFARRAAQEECAALKNQIAAGIESHNASHTRLVMGAASEEAVERAKYDLARLRIELVDMESRADAMRRALIILTGAPKGCPIPDPTGRATTPPCLPESVASSVLMRRPDIFAADRRIAAALHREAATRADYYPNVTLTATGGYTSEKSSALTDAGSKFWNLGPSVSLPIFSGFKTDADMELAKAEFERAWAGYKKTVLTAFKEVEDALAETRDLQTKSDLIAEQTAAGERTRDVILKKHTLGAASVIDVSIAERDLMETRRAAIRLRLDRANAAIRLFKSIGGGRLTPGDCEKMQKHLDESLQRTNAPEFDPPGRQP